MSKLDRYILSQLMGPFAIFALILIGIYWVARAIGLFDQLIADGQSVAVFFEIMILFLPRVVAIVLPVVSFAAAVFVSNRLHSESEMVVLQSSGMSPARLIRPYVLFSLAVALFAGALSHYLVPVSLLQLYQRQGELAEDVTTRMIVGGRFLHPTDDITFFVSNVQDDGSLVDIFLHDQRSGTRDMTYTAHKAVLLRRDDDARLVMFDGLIQTFDSEQQLLSKIQFDEFVFDIGTLTGTKQSGPVYVENFSTLDLLFPTDTMLRDSGFSADQLKIEAHLRIEQPLQSLVYPLIGMAVLMLGSFSRFGVLRQVLGAVLVVVLVSTLGVPIRDMVRRDADLWPLIYLPDLIGLILVGLMLRRAGRGGGRGLFRRRLSGVAA